MPETTESRGWEPELEELQRRRRYAEELGGADGVRRQHAAGRLTARERIALLVDDGSFREIGALTGAGRYDEDGTLLEVTPANVVIGTGRIDGRPVAVAADDFTVRGGSSEATSPEKWQFAERLALDRRIPLVRMVESAGGSIRLLEQSGASKIPGYPRWPIDEMLGTIPVVGLALGPCAGLGAIRVIGAHFSVMAEGTSQIFAAGPQVVEPGIGEDVSKEDLGGSKVHTRESGAVDNAAADEADAIDQARRFLSYLPSSALGAPPVQGASDAPERRAPELLTAVPRSSRRPYAMRPVLELILDYGSLFEISPRYGGSTITLLARLGGRPVGVLANDPRVAGGAMTDAAADKICRFVDMCDTFHLPVVNFVDQPGVNVGVNAERRGTIRKAMRAFLAISQARVPWCTVFLRRSFGVAGMAYAPLDRPHLRYAWPSAHWGSIPVEGGVEAAYRREIETARDPEERRAELVTHFKRFESPFRTAERFGVEDIIDPRDTRPLLCEWADDAHRQLPELLGVRTRMMRI
jgi:acetyl-CoA carboxylase carboxyltransferase component